MADLNLSVYDALKVLEPSIIYDASNYTYDSFISYDGYLIPVTITSYINIYDSLNISEIFLLS